MWGRTMLATSSAPFINSKRLLRPREFFLILVLPLTNTISRYKFLSFSLSLSLCAHLEDHILCMIAQTNEDMGTHTYTFTSHFVSVYICTHSHATHHNILHTHIHTHTSGVATAKLGDNQGAIRHFDEVRLMPLIHTQTHTNTHIHTSRAPFMAVMP